MGRVPPLFWTTRASRKSPASSLSMVAKLRMGTAIWVHTVADLLNAHLG